MSLTVVALGDSFSCGEGVGIEIKPEQTWVALLGNAMPTARLLNLSTAGARTRDVRRDQLPVAIDAAPQLATIMVGLNDVIRSGLSAGQLGEDMRAMVHALTGTGATVLIARWHDAGAVLGVPIRLRQALGVRLAQVNDAVETVAADAPQRAGRPHVRILDLGRIPELIEPGAWAVDGIHPSPAGHRAIARDAIAILADCGLPGPRLRADSDPIPMPAGPSTARRTVWLLSRGLPWLAQHSGRVAPAVLSMGFQAIRDRGQVNEQSATHCRNHDRSAALDVRSLVGGFGGEGAQALSYGSMSGLGQCAGTPEIAWTTG